MVILKMPQFNPSYLLHKLLSILPDGMVIVFDRDLRIQIANGPALADIGFHQKQLKGKSICRDDNAYQIFESCCRLALKGKTLYLNTPFRDRLYRTVYLPLRGEQNQVDGAMVVAIGITNVKQLEQRLREHTIEIENKTQKLRAINQLTIEAMENDRRTVAKELHDSVAGTLSAIKYNLEEKLARMDQPPSNGVATIEEIIDHLGNAINETRRISKGLHPAILDDLGLLAAIRQCIRDFKTFHQSINIIQFIDISENFIREELKNVIFRIIQEALNNIGKHSQAKNAEIRLSKRGDNITLQIKDDGYGFDLEKFLNNTGALVGFGLRSMRERVKLCNGSFQVQSQPGKGTMIIVTIPL